MKQYSRIAADSISDSRILSGIQGYFHEQKFTNTQRTEQTVPVGRTNLIVRNSGQNVKAWCRENGVCEQTYYKWQRRLFEMAQAQQAVSEESQAQRKKMKKILLLL